MTAQVFVNIPVKSIAKPYTYRVPPELSQVGAGWRVFVPFGGRRVEGFILETKQQTAAALAGLPLKDILAAVDEEAWFQPVMLEEARWMASFYLCSLAETMRLFMPGKSGLKITVSYVVEEVPADHMLLGTIELRQLYMYIAAHGPVRRAQLRKHFPGNDHLRDDLEKLCAHHLLRKDYEATKRDAARYERYVEIGRAHV